MSRKVLFILILIKRFSLTSCLENCDLKCFNGGNCKIGRAQFGYSSEVDEEDPIPLIEHDIDESNKYCECLAGFAGPRCEIALTLCVRQDQICSNGNPCKKKQDDQGGSFYHCECDASKTDFHSSYISHFCSRLSTVICTNLDSNGKTIRKDGFCSNGGTCTKAGNSHCSCKSGWSGPHCEFPSSQTQIPMDNAGSLSHDDKDRRRITSHTFIWLTGTLVASLIMGIAIYSKSEIFLDKPGESVLELSEIREPSKQKKTDFTIGTMLRQSEHPVI